VFDNLREKAISDGAQSLGVGQFAKMMQELKPYIALWQESRQGAAAAMAVRMRERKRKAPWRKWWLSFQVACDLSAISENRPFQLLISNGRFRGKL